MIGLDWGTEELHAVRIVDRKGRPDIVAAASVQLRDDHGEDRPLAAVFDELSAKISLRDAVWVALPNLALLVRYEKHDPLPEERLQRLLRLELLQHYNDPTEFCADVRALPIAGDTITHACVLAQASEVRAVQDQLRGFGIRRSQPTLAAASLAALPALLEQNSPADPFEDGYAVVIDLTPHGMRVAVVDSAGELLGCRELSQGAADLLAAIEEDRQTPYASISSSAKQQTSAALQASPGTSSATSSEPQDLLDDPDDLFDPDDDLNTADSDDDALPDIFADAGTVADSAGAPTPAGADEPVQGSDDLFLEEPIEQDEVEQAPAALGELAGAESDELDLDDPLELEDPLPPAGLVVQTDSPTVVHAAESPDVNEGLATDLASGPLIETTPPASVANDLGQDAAADEPLFLDDDVASEAATSSELDAQAAKTAGVPEADPGAVSDPVSDPGPLFLEDQPSGLADPVSGADAPLIWDEPVSDDASLSEVDGEHPESDPKEESIVESSSSHGSTNETQVVPATSVTRRVLTDEMPAAADHGTRRPVKGLKVAESSLDLSGIVGPGGQTQSLGVALMGERAQRGAEAIAVQAQGALRWIQGQVGLESLPLQRVYLSGASAKIPGLDQYFSRRLRAPVQLAELEGVPLAGAQAAALAWAGRPDGQAFRLVPLQDVRRQLVRQQVLPLHVAAAFVLLAMTAAILTSRNWSEAQSQRLKVYEAYRSESQQKVEKLTELQAQGWEKDLRAIAGRVFGARNLLYTIRALKELAPRDLWLVSMQTEGIDQPSQNNGRGSRRGNGRRAPRRGVSTNPEAALVQSDTVIDAGSILVEGRVRDNDDQFEHEMLRIWYESITAWSTELGERDIRLFRDYELVTPPGPSARPGEWLFSWRFFLLPTKISEEPLRDVSQLADLADDEVGL
jgi:hypothetical protein